MLRVDTPDKIRRQADRFANGGYGLLAGLAFIAALVGVGGFALLMLGGSRFTDYIGAALCLVWAGAGVVVVRWAGRCRASILKWQFHPQIAEMAFYRAHGIYEELSPETRVNYGLPLIRRMYELDAIDVRGGSARGKITRQIDARVDALRGLLDAEDKQRLYAADPLLADGDDVDAAKLWQQAVEQADQYLRHPEL